MCAVSRFSTGRKSREREASRSISTGVNALYEQGRGDVQVVGGRYGLSSKNFTPR
jgi:hypothetical protein